MAKTNPTGVLAQHVTTYSGGGAGGESAAAADSAAELAGGLYVPPGAEVVSAELLVLDVHLEVLRAAGGGDVNRGLLRIVECWRNSGHT